jgi:hypothetical protein
MVRLLAPKWSLVAGMILAAALMCASPVLADINCATDIAGCCCRGTRGNVDCDFNDIVDIVDLSILIDHLFISLSPLPSVDEANVDGLEEIDISDVTRLIDFLYISFLPLPGCPGPVNHPPVTVLLGKDSTLQPYVNSVVPTATNAGIHVSWIGQDKLDHPYEPQPLSYEWRVYGPYDSAIIPGIWAQFVKIVFVTTSRELMYKGVGNFIRYCDTIWIPEPPYILVYCDTMFVDTVKVANRFGTVDTIFDVEAAAFKYNPAYNKVALRSGSSGDSTTTDTSTYLMNFFNNAPSDTTVEGDFIFWVRAIDNDVPPKADPTPPYVKMKVIDGKHERDILIADAEVSYEINPRILSKAKQYWTDAIARWRPSTPHTYHMIAQAQGNILSLKLLLQHKVVVAVSDDVTRGVLNTPDIRKSIVAASSAGTNFWICGRAHLAGDEDRPPNLTNTVDLYEIGPWLGLSSIAYTGWDWYALKDPSVRIEDFIGAEPINPTAWPSLAIDSGYLHTRYGWGGDFYFPFVDSLSALPEVAFFQPVPEAEILYSYRSLYVGHHPLVPDSYFFAGKPVVYRFDRDDYRIFVSSFTPYAMAGDSIGGAAQVFIDSVLNWLYEPFTGQAASQSTRELIPKTFEHSNIPSDGSIPTDMVEVKP